MNFLRDDDPRKEVWRACESPLEQFLCTGLFVMLGCATFEIAAIVVLLAA